MIPEMEKVGYPRRFSSALTAAGGMVGVMIPPSIPFITSGVGPIRLPSIVTIRTTSSGVCQLIELVVASVSFVMLPWESLIVRFVSLNV